MRRRHSWKQQGQLGQKQFLSVPHLFYVFRSFFYKGHKSYGLLESLKMMKKILVMISPVAFCEWVVDALCLASGWTDQGLYQGSSSLWELIEPEAVLLFSVSAPSHQALLWTVNWKHPDAKMNTQTQKKGCCLDKQGELNVMLLLA